MIVIALNHFPVAVMAEGTTMAQAQEYCRELERQHIERHRQRNQATFARQYSATDVVVIKVEP